MLRNKGRQIKCRGLASSTHTHTVSGPQFLAYKFVCFYVFSLFLSALTLSAPKSAARFRTPHHYKLFRSQGAAASEEIARTQDYRKETNRYTLYFETNRYVRTTSSGLGSVVERQPCSI